MKDWIFLLPALALFLTSPAKAEMYMYTDDNGVVVFTDTPRHNEVNYRIYKSFKADYKKADYKSIINRAAERHGVDAGLIHAVITTESGFRETAISRKGAVGLMQLMPTTAAQMGVFNLFNPEENIEAGVRYLRQMMDRFGGDIRLALAAYNAGPTSVERYGGVPPIKETRRFITKVFNEYDSKRKARPSAGKARRVYRIVLEDGTVLFTNSKEYLKKASDSRWPRGKTPSEMRF
jgi:soluble lytic murein transglycosylase-like protein